MSEDEGDALIVARSAAAGVLGQARTEKKIAAVRENIKKAQTARRKEISEIECTCGRIDEPEPLLHLTRCRRYQTVYQRNRRAALQEALGDLTHLRVAHQRPTRIQRESVSPDEEPANILRGKRVVIVEDEGPLQMLLQRLVRKAKMQVVGMAATAKGGIGIVLQQKPDLVLMDIGMPGELNGLDAAETLLMALEVCIVMLAASPGGEFRSRAEKIGTCGYLVKPISEKTLIPYLMDLFQARRP